MMGEIKATYSGAIYEGMSPEERAAVRDGSARVAGLAGPMGAMQQHGLPARDGARLSMKSFAMVIAVQIMASQRQFDMPADEAVEAFDKDLRGLIAEMQLVEKGRTDG